MRKKREHTHTHDSVNFLLFFAIDSNVHNVSLPPFFCLEHSQGLCGEKIPLVCHRFLCFIACEHFILIEIRMSFYFLNMVCAPKKKISVDVRIFRAKMVRIKQDNLHAHCTHSLFFAAFVRHIYGRAHLIT